MGFCQSSVCMDESSSMLLSAPANRCRAAVIKEHQSARASLLSCVLQQSWVELLSSPAFHGSVREKAWRWLCRLRPLHCANSCLAECYTTHSNGHRRCLQLGSLKPCPGPPPWVFAIM